MDNILKTYQIEEEIIVEGKQVFAFSSALNSKRKINGCQARKYVGEIIAETEKQKAEAEAKLKEAVDKLTKCQILDNKLASAGFCKIDTPIYQKIDGIVVKDADGNPKIADYIHSATCSHKAEL